MFIKKWIRVICTLLIGMILVTGCAPAGLPTGPQAVWQLVVISDSSLWGVGEAFAARIEEDLGVTVEVEDYAMGGSSAGQILESLQTGKSANAKLEKLPAVLKEAEVVVMFLNPNDSIDPNRPLNLDGCFMSTAPESCSPETFEQWTTDLKAIWGEILQLRKGKTTILRAVDLYNPSVSLWKEHGIFEACSECWENMSDAARLAAEAYNIPCLSRLDAFNGPNHDEDPTEKGYISSDGEHLSELGVQYTADLLAQMGYEPVTPP